MRVVGGDPAGWLRAAGLLRLSSIPTGAVGTRDGRFVGATPLDVATEPSQRHRFQLSLAGYSPASFDLSLEKGALAERQIALSPALGDVDVRVSPDNAQISVTKFFFIKTFLINYPTTILFLIIFCILILMIIF